MEMEKEIYHALVDMVHDKIPEFHSIPTCELSEVIDMIEDMSKVIYNMTTVHAMESGGTSVTRVITPSEAMTSTTVVQ